MATLSHSELEQLWILAGGPESAADTAAAIAQAESGGCQYALAGPVDIRPVKQCKWTRTNGENSCGLWQINLRAHPGYSAPAIFGQVANAEAAVTISRQGTTFQPWSTYTNGAYKAFLTSAGTPTPQPGTVDSTSTSLHSARAFSGWDDLRQSANHHLPNQLERSRRIDAATLRLLTHRRRVRH